MVLVTNSTIYDVVAKLAKKEVLCLDTETTGLKPYHGDRAFSIIIGDDKEQYYFNLKDYEDETPVVGTGPLALLLAKEGIRWVMHNAKYDIAILEQSGLKIKGEVWCTLTNARLVYSEVNPKSLAYYGEKLGYPKDDGPTEYLKKELKLKKSEYDFTLVPPEIIIPYGCRDVEVTYRLYLSQVATLKKQNEKYSAKEVHKTQREVLANEIELLRTVRQMEKKGVKINVEFCRQAIEWCQFNMSTAEAEFESLSGHPFKKSGKLFQEIFADEKNKWIYGKPTAKKGAINPKFDSGVLKTLQNPVAKTVLAYSEAKANINFYNGFILQADASDLIHTQFNQAGTATGRFSSSSPNLQNLTKAEDEALKEKFTVRRAIVPRDDNVFHLIDYSQMEYRLMLHYAASLPSRYLQKDGVLKLISEVNAGKDVHQATADLAGISRKQAKTANFALLYGSGNKLMADRLGITEDEAKGIRRAIFDAAPEVEELIRQVMSVAEKRGFVTNWFGRRCDIREKEKSYRGPNYLIQGGCADIVKIAMNRCARLLRDYETDMVLSIHDEIVFEGPKDESLVVIPKVKHIMETVFTSKHLPLTCGVDHSTVSLADKKEGIYNEIN